MVMKNKLLIAILFIVPLLFLYGWIVSKEFFDNNFSFLLLTILSALITMVIIVLFLIVNDLVLVVPLIILFAIFILGYFAKFFLILRLILNNEEEYIQSLGSSLIMEYLNKNDLLRSYELATYGYVAFCFSVLFILFIYDKSRRTDFQENLSSEFLNKKRIIVYLLIGAILIAISSLFSINYRVGIHGGEAQVLPYKLNAVIHYFRRISFFFILLIVSWTDNKEYQQLWFASIILLALCSLSEIIVVASRGAFISSFAIPLALLWFVGKKFSGKRWIFVLSSITITLLLRPVFTVYRTIQNNFDAGVISNIKELYNYKNYVDIGNMAYQGINYIFYELIFRISGIESVLFFTRLTELKIDIPWIVSVFLGTENFSGRFTQEIVGFGENVTTHYAAPSLVGGLYWMGGILGIIVGVMILSIGSQYLWRKVINSNWVTSRLMLIIIVFIELQLGMEGTFEGIIREAFMYIFIVLFFEFICRSKNPFLMDNPARSQAVCQ